MRKYVFSFFKQGPSEEDLHVEVGSSLELLDAFLRWEHYEKFSGIANGYNGDEHHRWHNSVDFPGRGMANDVEFDVTRLRDLEYVEQMVADLWDRVAGGGS